MVSLASVLTFTNTPNVITPAVINFQFADASQVSGETAVAVPNEKGRKPKLKRQNTVNESLAQQVGSRRMETMATDFFTDISDFAATTGNAN